jgi:hypothetical protein
VYVIFSNWFAALNVRPNLHKLYYIGSACLVVIAAGAAVLALTKLWVLAVIVAATVAGFVGVIGGSWFDAMDATADLLVRLGAGLLLLALLLYIGATGGGLLGLPGVGIFAGLTTWGIAATASTMLIEGSKQRLAGMVIVTALVCMTAICLMSLAASPLSVCTFAGLPFYPNAGKVQAAACPVATKKPAPRKPIALRLEATPHSATRRRSRRRHYRRPRQVTAAAKRHTRRISPPPAPVVANVLSQQLDQAEKTGRVINVTPFKSGDFAAPLPRKFSPTP